MESVNLEVSQRHHGEKTVIILLTQHRNNERSKGRLINDDQTNNGDTALLISSINPEAVHLSYDGMRDIRKPVVAVTSLMHCCYIYKIK